MCESRCGDGWIAHEKECEDGNSNNGDGCSSKCLIEEGHFCSGMPSVCHAICGDSIKTSKEECDDGNTKN